MQNTNPNFATATAAELAAAGFTRKVLKAAKPRKAQLVYTSGVVNAGRGSGTTQKVG